MKARITPAEWEVMAVVWEKAPVAASAVAQVLKRRKNWALATVRTLLRRLVGKGILELQREGKRYLYIPRVSRDQCVRWESQSFVERVLGKVPANTLLHLVETAELSKNDIKELKRILRNKEK